MIFTRSSGASTVLAVAPATAPAIRWWTTRRPVALPPLLAGPGRAWGTAATLAPSRPPPELLRRGAAASLGLPVSWPRALGPGPGRGGSSLRPKNKTRRWRALPVLSLGGTVARSRASSNASASAMAGGSCHRSRMASGGLCEAGGFNCLR